jgi:hypothetical protein
MKGQKLKQIGYRAKEALSGGVKWPQNPNTIEGRAMVREHNERALQAFLDAGGTITELPPCGDGLDANPCGHGKSTTGEQMR